MKIPIVSLVMMSASIHQASAEWEKHSFKPEGKGSITTAVAIDYDAKNGMDIVTSYSNKVVVLVAPDFKEVVIHEGIRAIHSDVFDVDGDGDVDWIGSAAHEPPFWLENPGSGKTPWIAREIDADVNGVHCVLKADVDNDGSMDVIINSFKPEGPLADSISWYSIPKNVKSAKKWDRNVFADKDAFGGSHYFGFGDIDNDGWSEIAVAAKGGTFENGDWFAYWKNPGAEGLSKPWEKVIIGEGYVGATNILPGDFNADGKVDYIGSCGHGLGVFWFEAPDWKEHVIDKELSWGHGLTVADFDQDGDLDAASCGLKSERLSVYINDGKGDFTRLDLDDEQQSYDLRFVDMDGDGDMDLLNAGSRAYTVSWYENPLR